MKKLTGSIVALVTPFHEDGSVDFARLRELCDWHIANGTDAILALGTTGETASTSLEEDIKTLECVIDHVNGRVPVIAGAGSNSSEMQKHKSVIYSQMGASALLCISPYYVKTNEEGMYRHFMMSADAATAPIILYNVPGRTGCKISPDVVRRLSVHPNVMAIKEASGDISQIARIASLTSRDFDIYSGNDDQTIPIMSIGGVGCISTVANIIPADYHQMTTDFLKGRYKSAAKLQLKMVPLIRAVFGEVNPIPVKAALNMMGYIEKEYRMPMCEPTNETLYWLYDEMLRYGIRV